MRKEVFHLAWPIVVATGGETMMSLVDTKLVGGLGPAALGGVGVGAMFMHLGYSLAYGGMRAVKVQTAHAVGEGRPQDGQRYAQAGILLGVAVGAVMFVVGRDISWLLRLIGIEEELIGPACTFASAVTFGSIGSMVVLALQQHRQALGDTRTPMVVGLCANVINAVLAYSLIYGHLGLPALGVQGAGYATASCEYFECIVLGGLLLRDMRRSRKSTLPLREATRGVLELGLPTAAQFGGETLAFSAFTAVLGSMPSSEIASHQISLAVIRTSFLPGIAIGEAGSILVGRSLGERRIDQADRATMAALRLAVGLMAAAGLVFAVFGGAIARVFSTDADVIRITQRLLLVAAVFQVLDAINIVLRGALRGAKDVKAVAFIGTAVVWTCVPTAAYVLGKLAGLGAFGGWLGFIAETVFSAAFFGLRYARGGWRRLYTPSGTPGTPDRPLGSSQTGANLHAA